jgi:replicative DNA helicase
METGRLRRSYMDIQMVLMQVMKHRKQYEKLIPVMDVSDLDPDVRGFILSFGEHFKKFPDVDTISYESYSTMLALKGEQQDDTLLDRFEQIGLEPNPSVEKQIIRHIIQISYSASVEESIAGYRLGSVNDVYGDIRQTQEKFKKSLAGGNQGGRITDSIEDILAEKASGMRFSWRYNPLNDSMHDVRTGKTVIVAARPDVGKTSFLTDQVTHMRHSVKDQTDRPILWLNNEGKGGEILLTAYRSAINATQDEIAAFGGKRCQAAMDKYLGAEDAFIVYDVHGRHYTEIEQIIEELNPCLVVCDMLDNIKGFEGESRTDLRLEQLYIWFRESSVIYDYFGIASSQLSAWAEGVAFPDKGMLKDSKTGKAGACEGIITIGKKNQEPEDEIGLNPHTRYIGCPKNKFGQVNGASPTCDQECYFDFDRAHYHNPTTGGVPNA